MMMVATSPAATTATSAGPIAHLLGELPPVQLEVGGEIPHDEPRWRNAAATVPIAATLASATSSTRATGGAGSEEPGHGVFVAIAGQRSRSSTSTCSSRGGSSCSSVAQRASTPQRLGCVLPSTERHGNRSSPAHGPPL